MPSIKITIANKRAAVEGAPVIICGNSDYTLQFTFDAEWNDAAYKTARFVYVQNGKVLHEDRDFDGAEVQVPALANTSQVKVGVFAGELYTSTPAVIPCRASILCGSGEPANPTPEEDARIMALLNLAIEQQAEAEAAAEAAAAASREAQNAAGEVAAIVAGNEAYTKRESDARFSPVIKARVEGVTVSVNDSAEAPLLGLSLFGKSMQPGAPTPVSPADITHIGAAGEVDINANGQIITVSTSNGLAGLPVDDESLANYVDGDGQGWRCDEVDLARGVYIQRVRRYKVTGAENIAKSSTAAVDRYLLTLPSKSAGVIAPAASAFMKCSKGTPVILKDTATLYGCGVDTNVTDARLFFNFAAQGSSTVADFQQAITGSVVEYLLAAPVEIELAAEEVQAFKALQVPYPAANFSNSAGAQMAVSYAADTKTYIDNKFKELAAAIVANA